MAPSNTRTARSSARREGALRAFTSSAWRLLTLQLIVAAIALGAVGWSALKLGDVTRATAAKQKELEEIGGLLETSKAELSAAQERVTAQSQAYELFFSGNTRLASALASTNAQDVEIGVSGALADLSRAAERLPDDPTILRALARAQSANGAHGEAFATLSRVIDIERATADEADRAADLVARALYGCRAGEASGALAIAAAEGELAQILKLDRSLVADNQPLQRACANLPDAAAALRATTGATVAASGATTDASEASPYVITELFLHISQEEDRPKAEKVKTELAALGYRVLGIELIASAPRKNRSIRYFHDIQKEAGFVSKLQTDCTSAAASAGLGDAWQEPYREVSLAGRYERLPLNRAEIWF
ncbi:hypothetical protein GC169_10060 [bacterium]|nr:hypothetical protein [bacterium]